MNVEIRRGSRRFVERVPGRLSQHGFSFGEHYDPDRLSFGPMVCHDDHLLGRDVGFDEHAHEGLEIITWVVSGSVVHSDATSPDVEELAQQASRDASTGRSVTLSAGECGVLSAGSGTRHSEIAGPDGPARFVQVWLTPDAAARDAAPVHASAPVECGPGQGLVRAVGPGGPLTVRVEGAALDVVRLGANETLTLPGAPRVHAFVATGALLRSSLAEPLVAGDAFCWTGGASYDVTASVPTEMLVWSFAT